MTRITFLLLLISCCAPVWFNRCCYAVSLFSTPSAISLKQYLILYSRSYTTHLLEHSNTALACRPRSRVSDIDFSVLLLWTQVADSVWIYSFNNQPKHYSLNRFICCNSLSLFFFLHVCVNCLQFHFFFYLKNNIMKYLPSYLIKNKLTYVNKY